MHLRTLRQVEGIFQKILYVDLTKGLIGEEKLPLSWYRDFIGGLGVGMQYLFEDLKLRNPVLSDPIILMTGPLTGNPVPAASKAIILSYRGSANHLKISTIEGDFPAYLKLAGFDGFVLSGTAEGPTGLFINSRESSLVDSSGFWGRDVLTTDEGIRGASADIATLTIGPAGECGNPFASIIADQFIMSGPGLGADLGRKNIKYISAEADAELAIHGQPETLERNPTQYRKDFLRRIGPGEIRRSCFGCVQCCGLFVPHEGILVLEPDLVALRDLLPQLSYESQIRFFKECLKQGVDPIISANSMADMIKEDTFQTPFAELISRTKTTGVHCINTRSWTQAQLNLNQWYRDVLFRDVDSIRSLVQQESMAMVKNCLALCERCHMPVKEILLFLNAVTGRNYGQGDLEKIGENLIHQISGFYRDLDYKKIEPIKTDPCSKMLPSVLRENAMDYVRYRSWDERGYPAA